MSSEDGHHIEETGQVVWKNLTISTLGECACWGSLGSARENVLIKNTSKRLYELDPHNVDFARQSLGLLIGVGILAHYAVQYAGSEDITADATWQEPRLYPLPD